MADERDAIALLGVDMDIGDRPHDGDVALVTVQFSTYSHVHGQVAQRLGAHTVDGVVERDAREFYMTAQGASLTARR